MENQELESTLISDGNGKVLVNGLLAFKLKTGQLPILR